MLFFKGKKSVYFINVGAENQNKNRRKFLSSSEVPLKIGKGVKNTWRKYLNKDGICFMKISLNFYFILLSVINLSNGQFIFVLACL